MDLSTAAAGEAEARLAVRNQVPELIGSLRAKSATVERPNREAGYSIQNAAGDEAVVRIYDEIWWLGVNAADLVRDLDNITAPSIRVEINSPGGDVFDGITIYNALRLHPATITTRVDGLAASIASVIAQAGDHRVMVTSSQMMIHNAFGLAVGDKTDHTDMAAILEQQDGIIAGIYATASGNDAAHFRALMDAETWLTAEQAISEGLADEILDPSRTEVKDTLFDQISAAADAVAVVVSSTEAVVAVRAEAGKHLSNRNRDCLIGLRDHLERIDGLLNDGSTVEGPATEPPDVVDGRMALARRTNAFRAHLPVDIPA